MRLSESPTYLSLNDKEKNIVDGEYRKCYDNTISQIDISIDTKDLVKNFLMPEEGLVPVVPLDVDNYKVHLSSEPINDRFIDEGSNVKLFLTNKRLLIVDVKEFQYPNIKKDANKIEVGYKSTNWYNFISYSLNNIYGISFKLENDIANTSLIHKTGLNVPLMVFGAVLAFLGVLFANNLKESSIIIILIGLAIIVVGLFLKSESITGPISKIRKTRIIRLVVLDHIYKNRSSLIIEINETHNLESIIKWIIELQNRCQNIDNPKFETIMNI